jgi:hypothetical protein
MLEEGIDGALMKSMAFVISVSDNDHKVFHPPSLSYRLKVMRKGGRVSG